MLLTQLKIAMALLLALGLSVGTGGLALTHRVQATQETKQEEQSNLTRARIESLIAQLGSREFRERDAATKALDAIGRLALPALRKAATASDDLEGRKRAEGLIQSIEGRLSAVREFRGHAQGIYQTRFSPDGSRFLSSSYDGTMKLWETKTGKEL